MPSALFISNAPYTPSIGSTNRQRLARAAAKDGWSVTYLETIGLGLPRRRPHDGIEVRHAANILPWSAAPENWPIRRVNHLATRISQLRGGGFDLVVCYDPLAGDLVRAARGSTTVYDCVDAYEYQPQYSRLSAANALRSEERSLAQLADLRIATSRPLSSRKERDWGLPVHVIEGAHEIDSEIVPERTSTGQERALLVTALDAYKFDARPVLEWLSVNPARTVTIAGRTLTTIDEPIRELLNHSRVTVKPPVNQTEFAELAANSDVGLVSLTASPYSIYSFPLKTWDYMMRGLPVLAWKAPSLKDIVGVTHLDRQSRHDLLTLEQSPTALVEHARRYSSDSRWARLKELL